MYRILGIGELLWDLFPQGKQLGGAPANYGVMAARLGNHAAVLSRVGDDPFGREAMAVLEPLPVDCSHIQLDAAQPTGTVSVHLQQGQPSYIIHEPVAWDFFELTGDWKTEAEQADAVCFGSLAQRGARSRQVVHALLRATRAGCQRIFDVNLRAPFYTPAIVRTSLELASVMKMNDVEVPQVLALLELPTNGTLQDGAERLLGQFPALMMVAITCGGEGSLLVDRSGWHRHTGVPTKVKDTVGAGDAFTAAMTHYLLRGAPLSILNEAGNRWGSFIASQSGAMPEISEETLLRMAAEIEA